MSSEMKRVLLCWRWVKVSSGEPVLMITAGPYEEDEEPVFGSDYVPLQQVSEELKPFGFEIRRVKP